MRVETTATGLHDAIERVWREQGVCELCSDDDAMLATRTVSTYDGGLLALCEEHAEGGDHIADDADTWHTYEAKELYDG